jgi:hypothetical protein
MSYKEAGYLAPALLRYSVCKQCRIDAYKDQEFYGWNEYCEAWWKPCLTTTPFSFGKVVLRAGHIYCPPKVFLDMQQEVIDLIKKTFTGDKRELLCISSASCPTKHQLHITNPAPDWCPCKILQKAIQEPKPMTIFGAAIFNKVIRFCIVCLGCNHEWYVEEKLPKSTSSAGGIFVTNSISTKTKIVCEKCKQKADIAALKRLFFYG